MLVTPADALTLAKQHLQANEELLAAYHNSSLMDPGKVADLVRAHAGQVQALTAWATAQRELN